MTEKVEKYVVLQYKSYSKLCNITMVDSYYKLKQKNRVVSLSENYSK